MIFNINYPYIFIISIIIQFNIQPINVQNVGVKASANVDVNLDGCMFRDNNPNSCYKNDENTNFNPVRVSPTECCQPQKCPSQPSKECYESSKDCSNTPALPEENFCKPLPQAKVCCQPIKECCPPKIPKYQDNSIENCCVPQSCCCKPFEKYCPSEPSTQKTYCPPLVPKYVDNYNKYYQKPNYCPLEKPKIECCVPEKPRVECCMPEQPKNECCIPEKPKIECCVPEKSKIECCTPVCCPPSNQNKPQIVLDKLDRCERKPEPCIEKCPDQNNDCKPSQSYNQCPPCEVTQVETQSSTEISSK